AARKTRDLMLEGIEPPLAGHALQLVRPAVHERDAGAGDEIADGLRAEDFVRFCARGDPRSDRDRDARDLAVGDRALAGVDAHTNGEVEPAHVAGTRPGA